MAHCSIYQEVWKSGKLYEYPASNLDNVKSVMGPLTDGWGVTTDQTSLIMSDGQLHPQAGVDPTSLTVTKSIKVGPIDTSCIGDLLHRQVLSPVFLRDRARSACVPEEAMLEQGRLDDAHCVQRPAL